nr:zinc finger, CCHC-type [Tanacetum cinerariifolium]
MLEPVKVKCIFLGYHKSIVGNKLWRLDDITSKIVLYKNMGFNESGEYKKTFIGSGVGTGSMQVLHRFELEVKPLGDHTFEVEPQENIDQGAGLQEVQTQDLIDYQLAHDREQHLACELFGYRENSNEAAFVVAAVEKIYAHESLTFNNTVSCEVISKWKAGLKDDMDARSDVYVLSNGYRKCSNDSDGYYWGIHQATKGLLDKAKENVLGMEIVKDQSGYTLRVSQSRFYNEKLEYQMVCTRPDIASTDVGMLDGFDRGLQTYVQVFVDFDYAMGRSITRYGFMILGCAESLKANLQHMEALSTTKVGYMTFTEAWKKKIWLKGLLTESRYELRLVAGIAIGALVKGCSRSEVPAQVKVDAYRSDLFRTSNQVVGCQILQYACWDLRQERRKHACVDLTGVSPLVWLSSRDFTAGHAALKAASGKVTKHEKSCIKNQHVFIPFAFDTFGFLAPEAVELLIRVQRVMHSNVMTLRSRDVVFKRMSFAIQKGLAS